MTGTWRKARWFRLRLVACVVSAGLVAACAAPPPTAAPMAPTSAVVWSRGPGWHTTAIQSFPEREIMDISGLACTGPDQCDAVGTYAPDRYIVPFVMTGLTSGQPPVLVTLRMPAGTISTDTSYLACASPGYCAVVGTYQTLHGPAQSYGFTATESGGHWTAARPAAPPVGSEGIEDLRGVACTSPGNCVAVGRAWTSEFVEVPIVLTESDGTWGRAAYLSMPPDFNANFGGDLFSVSCASAGSCVAAGDYAVKSGLVAWPMVVVESGGRWLRAEKTPLPADANRQKKVGGGFAFSVSCTPGGTCLAVGEYTVNAAGANRGLVITEANGRFGQVVETPQDLRTVSCVPRFCVVSSFHGPVVSYSAGRWNQLGPIQPSAGVVKIARSGAGLGSVHPACLADGRCVAVSTFSGENGPTIFLVSTHNYVDLNA